MLQLNNIFLDINYDTCMIKPNFKTKFFKELKRKIIKADTKKLILWNFSFSPQFWNFNFFKTWFKKVGTEQEIQQFLKQYPEFLEHFI